MPGLMCRRGAATRVRARVCVRVRSPLQQYKKSASFIGAEDVKSSDIEINHDDLSLNCCKSDNRVMVVIDSNGEANGAVQWALSHAVQSQGTIILLHVAKKDGETSWGKEGSEERAYYDLLQATKNMCQQRRPEVCVEIAIRRGKEKGVTIVDTAKQLKASVLVLGHRKPSFLRRIWRRKVTSGKMRVIDYCIQNANCLTIAVRRKNRKYGGGYLITTKRHKNFWLLA